MKKLIFACIILAAAATACESSYEDISVAAPATENTANGDQPVEPDPGDKPGS